MSRRALLIVTLVTSSVAAAAPAQAAPGDERVLQQAYQKEFAYLQSTKRQLTERIDAAEAAMARDAQQSAHELAVLEQALLSDQKLGGGALPERTNALATLDAALLDLHRAHAEQGSLRRAPGVFFDAFGKKVDGEIVRLGGLAAWGVRGGDAGPLAPAGGGAFKLWPESQGRGVPGFIDGHPPALVDTFLFASKAHAVDVKEEKQALQIVRAGGAVAWVIVGLGAFAALLIVLRWSLLLWLGRGRRALVGEIQQLVGTGRSAEAVRRCRARAGAFGHLLATAVTCTALPREVRADLLEEALLRALPAADRFGAMIIVIAAASPLLGLLGTVSGMISTFDVITEHGTGDPRMLSGGISEALITTELGLIVAIPALFFGNVLMGWGERLKRDLEAGALAVAYGDDLDVLSDEEPA
jgi:biopolymer transport protein ExbB